MTGRTKWLYVGLGAGGALALILGTAFAALTVARAGADTGESYPPPQSRRLQASPTSPQPGGHRPDRLALGGYSEALAEALGIDQDSREAAWHEARQAAIEAAVE